MSAPTVVTSGHRPLWNPDRTCLRCSCGSYITPASDGQEAALIRHAGHLAHVATARTGATR